MTHAIDLARLGGACLRALELRQHDYDDYQVARTLRAWWPDCAPVEGERWTHNTAYLAARWAHLYLAIGDAAGIETAERLAQLGLGFIGYVRDARSVHGSVEAAVAAVGHPPSAAAIADRASSRSASTAAS